MGKGTAERSSHNSDWDAACALLYEPLPGLDSQLLPHRLLCQPSTSPWQHAHPPQILLAR